MIHSSLRWTLWSSTLIFIEEILWFRGKQVTWALCLLLVILPCAVLQELSWTLVPSELLLCMLHDHGLEVRMTSMSAAAHGCVTLSVVLEKGLLGDSYHFFIVVIRVFRKRKILMRVNWPLGLELSKCGSAGMRLLEGLLGIWDLSKSVCDPWFRVWLSFVCEIDRLDWWDLPWLSSLLGWRKLLVTEGCLCPYFRGFLKHEVTVCV